MKNSWIYIVSILLLFCGIGAGAYYEAVEFAIGSILAFVVVIFIMSFQMKRFAIDDDYENISESE